MYRLEPPYTHACPRHGVHTTYNKASAKAQELNAALGLTKGQAYRIVRAAQHAECKSQPACAVVSVPVRAVMERQKTPKRAADTRRCTDASEVESDEAACCPSVDGQDSECGTLGRPLPKVPHAS